jgi:hypothetical protein
VRDIFLFVATRALRIRTQKSFEANTWSGVRTGKNGSWLRAKKPMCCRAFLCCLLRFKLLINTKRKEWRMDPAACAAQPEDECVPEGKCRCVALKKMTFHQARHTYATTITLTNGVSIETVSKMLGYRNLKTTMRGDRARAHGPATT